MYVCLYVCVRMVSNEQRNERTHVRSYVCTYLRMHVYVCICMYTCIHIDDTKHKLKYQEKGVGYDRASGLECRRDTVIGLLQVEAEISVLVTSKGLGR